MEIILSTQRTKGSHHYKECMDQIADNVLTIANYMEGRGKDKAVTHQDIKTEEIITGPFTTMVTTTGDTTIENTMPEDTNIMDTTTMSTIIIMDT